MPELPEIELSRQYVDSTCLDKKISKVEIPSSRLLQSPKSDFVSALEGNKLVKTERLGKYLFLKTNKGSWLVFHFGMTGKLEYYTQQDPPKYTHLILSFEDNYFLAYICRRMLGKIYLSDSLDKFKEEHTLGKDALKFNQKDFNQLIQEKERSSIKAALTDQHAIAGIGNVYSDEMLYHAKIHPKSKTGSLKEKEIKELFGQISKVLKLAIKLGGKRAKFPSYFLIRHRKEGDDCPNCKGKIEMIKVSGRSTYFCPACQKEKS